MTNSHLISVIIWIKDTSSNIDSTLLSICQQSYQNIELIVLDEGNNQNIINQIEFDLNLKKYYYNKYNFQDYTPIEHGINQANGDYIAIIESGDSWSKNHLENNLEIALKTNCDGIYGAAKIKENDFHKDIFVRKLYDYEGLINYLLTNENGIIISSLFLKILPAKKIKWDHSLAYFQVYDFLIRFSKKSQFKVNTNVSILLDKNNQHQWEYDLKSCIEFISKHKNQIIAEVYNKFYNNLLFKTYKHNVEKKILNYLKKNAVFYIRFLPLRSYLSVYRSKNRLHTFWHTAVFYIRKEILLNIIKDHIINGRPVYFKRFIKSLFLKEKYESKIFCIGYNKTGTTSLGKSFEILGFTRSTFNKRVWQKYYANNDVRKILKYTAKFEAFDDLPWLKEDIIPILDNTFSNSKFVYLTRDEASWKKSYYYWWFKVFKVYPDVEKGWQEYKRHEAFVLNYFKNYPKDRFIILNINDDSGFKKLADFLGKETTIKRFPHFNKT